MKPSITWPAWAVEFGAPKFYPVCCSRIIDFDELVEGRRREESIFISFFWRLCLLQSTSQQPFIVSMVDTQSQDSFFRSLHSLPSISNSMKVALLFWSSAAVCSCYALIRPLWNILPSIEDNHWIHWCVFCEMSQGRGDDLKRVVEKPVEGSSVI